MNSRKVFLVTGASGFVGAVLCNSIRRSDDVLRLLVRKIIPNIDGDQFVFKNANDIGQDAFLGVDIVIHLAGYAHDTSNKKSNREMYRNVNVDLTEKILDLSVQNKVKKFIFVSSVKAGGGEFFDKCLNENDQSEPKGVYGRTKREAELKLLKIGRESNMHVSIIRPSLVYGPGAKGNLQLMLSAVKKGWWPPLPETGNKRSMIHVDDLVKAILLVLKYDCTNGEIYIVTDGRLYSSRELYETMCNLVGKSIPKWSVPKFLFDMVALISPSIKYKVDKLLGDECYSSEKLEGLGFKSKRVLKEMNETSF